MRKETSSLKTEHCIFKTEPCEMKMDSSILKWERREVKTENHFFKKGLSGMKKKHTFLGIQSCCLKKYVVSVSSRLPLQMIL